MKSKAASVENVDAYIERFPGDTQKLLNQIRATILKAAPKAEEGIGYQMPAYNYLGPLVYFAAYEKHIGFYPTASGITVFKEELSGYKSSKGAVQFPLDKPLPVKLITTIVKYRVKENKEKAALKAAKKK